MLLTILIRSNTLLMQHLCNPEKVTEQSVEVFKRQGSIRLYPVAAVLELAYLGRASDVRALCRLNFVRRATTLKS